MKLKYYIILFILICTTPCLSHAEQTQSLTARIENAKYQKESSSITLDFILTNSSEKPIRIAERWNSWGAFQWSIKITNSDRTVIDFKNPQMAWFRNFLSIVTIEPGEELHSHCILILQAAQSNENGSFTFIPTMPATRFSFPLSIIGVFASPKLYKLGKVDTNWTGSITTPALQLTE